MSHLRRPIASAWELRRIPLVIGLMLLWSGVLHAQVTSGTLFGTVKDPSGAVVVSATVTITNPAVGLSRILTTSGSGDFVAPNLPPGTYRITVEAPGFKKLEKTDVVLSATDRLNAGEFILAVGAVSEQVTVTADAGQLEVQSNSGERSDLITNNQIKNLALNGRNILELVKVVPGVMSEIDGQQAGRGNLDQFYVNGTRGNEHEYTIDGTSNVDTGNNGAIHVTLNPDAVAEVKVLTSNYQAEYGKAGGGQVVVTTKGGTTQFHGNLRWFYRDQGMNANEWFANQSGTPIGRYHYNYAGYEIGGPVLIPGTGFNKNRDKLYFFFGQEYYRQLIPGGTVQVRLPTPAEIGGDFSQSYDSNGKLLVIYNPATGKPFPANKIDPSTLSPAQQSVFSEVQKILSLYPKPNVTGVNAYNFSNVYSSDNPRREDYLRLDYQINSANRIYGRWINNSSNAVWPQGVGLWGGYSNLQFPGGILEEEPGWNLALNLVSTIRPTLLNEISFGPSVSRTTFAGSNGNISRGVNGITLPLLYPVRSDTPIPDISFGGNLSGITWANNGYLGALPWYQANTTINFSDNLSKVLRNHTLKFGAFYQRSRKDQPAWGNYNGQFNIDNCITSSQMMFNCSDNTSGYPYASALLGYFSRFDQSSARPVGYFRYTNLAFYAQDTWKFNPRLTLDYGLRLTWMPAQFDARNQVAVFNPSLYDPAHAVRLYANAPQGGGVIDPANPGTVIPDPNGVIYGTIVPGYGSLTNGMAYANVGYPRGGWNDQGLMPEPRLGFAYDLTGDHKTVLRGGFGTAHDRIQGNLIFNPVFTNPQHVLTPIVINNNMSNLPSLAASGAQPVLSSIVGADKKGQVPVVYSFSLGVQRELGWGTTLDVAYVGTLSRHLITARNLNQVPWDTTFTAAAQDPSKYPGGVVPPVEANLPTAYSSAGFNFSGQDAYDIQFLSPYQGYGNIEYLQFDGTANYNSLQVSLQRRFSKGLTFGAAYTYSKTLTTASADEDYVSPFDSHKYDYRPAAFDRTHVLAVNYVYDLPNPTKHFNGPKWLSYITDDYQLSGFTSVMSGAPLPVWAGTAVWWPPAQWITGSVSEWIRPGFYLPTTNNVNQSVGTSKFNPGAFLPPTIGVPLRGNRDLRGGGLQNWDMSLFKNIPLGHNEQRYLQLRLEAFNVFNHPNFKDVNLPISVNTPSGTTPATLSLSPTRSPGCTGAYGTCFGEYNDTYTGNGGPRVVQLAVKLYF